MFVLISVMFWGFRPYHTIVLNRYQVDVEFKAATNNYFHD